MTKNGIKFVLLLGASVVLVSFGVSSSLMIVFWIGGLLYEAMCLNRTITVKHGELEITIEPSNPEN